MKFIDASTNKDVSNDIELNVYIDKKKKRNKNYILITKIMEICKESYKIVQYIKKRNSIFVSDIYKHLPDIKTEEIEIREIWFPFLKIWIAEIRMKNSGFDKFYSVIDSINEFIEKRKMNNGR